MRRGSFKYPVRPKGAGRKRPFIPGVKRKPRYVGRGEHAQ